MSLESIHADDIEEGLQRWAAHPGPDPGSSFRTVGFLGAGLKALPAAAFDVAAAGADAASGLTSSLLATGGGEGFSQPGQDQSTKPDFDTAGGNALRRKADEFSPDPLTAHAADQVLHGLVRFGAKAGLAVGTMGPFGALLLGAEETENETQRLRAQGVDTGTAVKVGAVQGVASAVGAVMPLGGKTILQTLGLVAAGGPGMFMGQEALSKKILQSAGQNDQASLHNPFDPLGLAVSTIVPGAFGALHMHGEIKRTALEQVVEHIESGGNRYGKDGELLTSPKGAQGEMQVMPGTATDPGFGVTPARDHSPEELARVGRDYLGAMATRYGDSDKALAAYNAGPGAVDKAIAAHGDDWLKHLPRETQVYVHKANALGARHAGEVAAQDPANVDAARVATTNDALTRGLPDTPDAVGQVQRASDIVAEDGGRAAEQMIPAAGVDVFHGTKAEVGIEDLSKTLDLGPHFTTSRDTAELFANSEGTPGRVLEGRANFQKPLDLPDLNGWFPTNVAAAVDEAHGVKAAADGQTPLQARVWAAMEKAKADYFDAQPEAYQGVRNKLADLSPAEKALKDRVFNEGMARSQEAGYGVLKQELRAAGYDSIRYKNANEGAPVDTFIALDMGKVGSRDAALPRESNNALPPHDSIKLAGDEPAKRGAEVGTGSTKTAGKPAPAKESSAGTGDSNSTSEAPSIDHQLAQKLATEQPDLKVTLPGSDERMSVAEAMQRIAEEQKQDGQWADLVRTAVECALANG